MIFRSFAKASTQALYFGNLLDTSNKGAMLKLFVSLKASKTVRIFSIPLLLDYFTIIKLVKYLIM